MQNTPQTWLIKYAARRKAWDEILLAGSFTLRGVRNLQARNYLAAMRRGDMVLHYQSQENQAVVGISTVAETAFQDSSTSDPRWVSVKFTPCRTFTQPVSLAQMRSDPQCAALPLLRQPRLSVMPVTPPVFKRIQELGTNA